MEGVTKRLKSSRLWCCVCWRVLTDFSTNTFIVTIKQSENTFHPYWTSWCWIWKLCVHPKAQCHSPGDLMIKYHRSDNLISCKWHTLSLVADVGLLGALCRWWSQIPGRLFAVSVWHSALFYTPAVSLIEFTSVETSSREILQASNWLDGRFLCRGPEAVIFIFLATLDIWQEQSSVVDSYGNMNIILWTCLYATSERIACNYGVIWKLASGRTCNGRNYGTDLLSFWQLLDICMLIAISKFDMTSQWVGVLTVTIIFGNGF